MKFNRKNVLYYIAFKIVYELLVVFLSFILFTVSYNISNNERFSLLLGGSILCVLTAFIDSFVCATVKKFTNSSESLGKCMMLFDWGILIFLAIAMFTSTNNNLIFSDVFLWLIILKMPEYHFARRLVLHLKKEYSISYVLYWILIITLTYVVMFKQPSYSNLLLFRAFGKTNFSSKEIHETIVTAYNEDDLKNHKPITYFNTLTNRGVLESINSLTVDNVIMPDDLKKLTHLDNLIIENVKTNKKLDYSTINLSLLRIQNCNLNYLNIGSNNLDVRASKIRTLQQENLEKIMMDNSKVDDLKLNSEITLSNTNGASFSVTLKKIEITNGPTFFLDNGNYMTFSHSYSYTILVPEGTVVGNLKTINASIAVYDSNGEITDKNTMLKENDELRFYDGSGNLFYNGKVEVR